MTDLRFRVGEWVAQGDPLYRKRVRWYVAADHDVLFHAAESGRPGQWVKVLPTRAGVMVLQLEDSRLYGLHDRHTFRGLYDELTDAT